MYHRFLSPDPARDQHFEQTQSWNIYSYVQNNPVMKFDPTGEAGFWAGVWDGIKSYPGQMWQMVRHPIQTAERQQAERMASVAKHGFVGAVAREVGKEFVKALPSGGQLLAGGKAASQAVSGDTHGAGKTLGGQLASDATSLGLAYAGAKLPPLVGRAVGASSETTLFRAVGEAERAQVQATSTFQAGPNSLGGKWFAESAAHAEQWGNVLNGPGASTLLEVKVPTPQANQFFRLDRLDGIGPARYAELEQLAGAKIKELPK